MGRCVACDKLTRKTLWCSYYKAFMALKVIHRNEKCDGYKWKKCKAFMALKGIPRRERCDGYKRRVEVKQLKEKKK